MEKHNHVVKGMALAGLASVSWGVSGTVLQYISQNLAVPAAWMLSTRTMITGIILLLISAIIYRKKIFDIFKTKSMILSIISYGVFGLAANLYTFYYAVQTGNASVATILQYLSPLFIVLGAIFFQGRKPLRLDIVSFLVALVGVFFCITRGDLSHLAVPMNSLLWGIGSGITAALYVVLPRKASMDYPPIVVLAWGTFIAGVLFNIMHPFWINPPHASVGLISAVGTVIIFGTIFPFGVLLYATRFAPSDVVSIMDALQPIVTTILSVIFFHIKLTTIEIIGIILVLLAIYILQYGRRSKIPKVKKEN